MKFFKYLFFLLVLVFVIGSLYIATVSIPEKETVAFQTPVNAELFKIKIEDLSSYSTWFEFPERATSEKRLSNPESPENTTLSWQNDRFESINLQNRNLGDSITQQLKLKTWLSSSEFDISWTFKSSEKNSNLIVHLTSDASFWQKTEYVLTGNTHLEQTKAAITESLSKLEQSIKKEIAVYSISPIGKVETGGFYLLHATSAARLNFESIKKKSQPIFESVERFMDEQDFKIYKGRIIFFENLYAGSDNIIFSSGIGSENQIAIPEYFEVLSKYIGQGTYFKTQLTGDHINLRELLTISKSTLEDRELIIDKTLNPYMEFEVDKSSTINPAEWKTNFYIPIISK